MKNVLKALAKIVLIRLGLTSKASATHTGIRKKIRVWNKDNNNIKKQMSLSLTLIY